MRLLPLLSLLVACAGPSVSETDTDTDTDAAPCVDEVPDEAGVVPTTSGLIRGELAEVGFQWRGVPFAEPPARWTPPEAPACWQGVRDALDWPDACAQVQFSGDEGAVVGSEDCLYLNVFSPAADDQARPVLVFIHGGGNQQGSSSQVQDGTPLYAGDLLANRHDAVVVTLQYRLGPFGFLTHPALADDAEQSGNYGLLDQVRALEWVQGNIDAFGGDSSRVLVFGESGGAVDTCFLAASPLTEGLMSGALMQSGACVIRDRATDESEGLARMEALGCADAGDRACLEALSVDTLLSSIENPDGGGIVQQVWGAHIDGWVVPEDPLTRFEAGRHTPIPFIVGSNADETSRMIPPNITPAFVRAVFSRYSEPLRSQFLAVYPPGETDEVARDSYLRATTDSQFTCQARRIARALSAGQDEPVYRYFFDHTLDTAIGRRLGAFHGLELLYVFATLERTDSQAGDVSDADAGVIELMGSHWTSFAAEAAPASGFGPTWPVADDGIYVINDEPSVSAGVRDTECDLWDQASGGG